MIERSLIQVIPIQIYRDWMKTARIIGIEVLNIQDGKTEAIRSLLRVTWKGFQHETDKEKIEIFREDQIRGLSNYLIYKIKSELIDKK